MTPSSPQTPRVPLASIINIDSPISAVSNTIPHSHSPFASNYARRLSGNENDPSLAYHSTSRRSSYSNTSRRSSQRMSVGSISTIAEDDVLSSNNTAFDDLLERTLMGTEHARSHNSITPYVDENLPTPTSQQSVRSRLSTSSYPRTPLTTFGNSVPVTPMSKLTVKSVASSLRTPLGQQRADSHNRLSPAAQRFIASTNKITQHSSFGSPHKHTPQTTSIFPHIESSHNKLLHKVAVHSDENDLVENLRHLSVTPRSTSASLLSPTTAISRQHTIIHPRTPSTRQLAPLGSDIASNVRKMR